MLKLFIRSSNMNTRHYRYRWGIIEKYTTQNEKHRLMCHAYGNAQSIWSSHIPPGAAGIVSKMPHTSPVHGTSQTHLLCCSMTASHSATHFMYSLQKDVFHRGNGGTSFCQVVRNWSGFTLWYLPFRGSTRTKWYKILPNPFLRPQLSLEKVLN